jgi:polar amino acid transport system permease protein
VILQHGQETQSLDTPVDAAAARHERHPIRWVLTAVVLVIVAQLIHLLVTNGNLQWNVVGEYMDAAVVLHGLQITIEVAIVAMLIGVVLGVLLAVCRQSDIRVVRTLSSLYIWFFRGTPALVQLIFWYNLSTFVSRLSIGIPFGPEFVSWKTNSLITPLVAAIVGLGLNEAAYMAEIIRGGLLSVDAGQTEAANALAMTRGRTLRRIVIPQAMRFIVPPTGNEVISMVKATSLVSVIALSDLLYSVESVYNRTFQTIPLLLVASIWYLVLTSVLYAGQSYLEHHYGRGNRNSRASIWDVLAIRHAKPATGAVAPEEQ